MELNTPDSGTEGIVPPTGFTNARIWEIALRQSAVDAGCRAEDFLGKENVIVTSRKNPEARKYLELPFSCQFITYGNNIVASAAEEFREIALAYLARTSVEHCFETPDLYALNDALAREGLRVRYMAEYFLPDVERLRVLECPYPVKLLGPENFGPLYVPTWSNALCEKRRELDVLGAGAYDGERLVGLAGCSADCEAMWQIGIDVLPEYRGRGIASALISRLALEVLKRDKVPFYCAAWCNIKSVRNAVRSGFRPAWAEMTVKEYNFTNTCIS